MRFLTGSIFYRYFLAPDNVVPRKVTYRPLTESIIEMIKAGLGVTVMANWLLRPYLDTPSLKIIRLTKDLQIGIHPRSLSTFAYS